MNWGQKMWYGILSICILAILYPTAWAQVVPGNQYGGPWPAFCVRRTDTVSTGPGNMALAWRYMTGSYVFSSPGIDASGNVFVGSYDNFLYKFNGATGALIWRYQVDSPVFSSPAIDASGNVFVGSWDSYLYKISGATGALMWRYQTGGGVYSSPAIDASGNVIVGSLDSHLYKINGATGTMMWRCQTGSRVFSSPAIDASGNVFVGSEDTYLYRINGASGALMWRYKTGYSVTSSPVIDAFGNVFVGSHDRFLYKINGATGTLMWSYLTDNLVEQSPAIDGFGNVFVGSGDYLYKINGTTGALVWRYQTDGTVTSPASIDVSFNVFVGSMPGYLHKINGATGEPIWKYQMGSALSSPAIDATGNVFVGSGDNSLYKFEIDLSPTRSPTPPTMSPTKSPTPPTKSPTESPTWSPTISPTRSPTRSPTLPTRSPTGAPTQSPTPQPTTVLEFWAQQNPVAFNVSTSLGPVVLIAVVMLFFKCSGTDISWYETFVTWFALVDFLGDVLYILTQDFSSEQLLYASVGLLFAPPTLFALITWRMWVQLSLNVVQQILYSMLKWIDTSAFDEIRCRGMSNVARWSSVVSVRLGNEIKGTYKLRSLEVPRYANHDKLHKVLHVVFVKFANFLLMVLKVTTICMLAIGMVIFGMLGFVAMMLTGLLVLISEILLCLTCLGLQVLAVFSHVAAVLVYFLLLPVGIFLAVNLKITVAPSLQDWSKKYDSSGELSKDGTRNPFLFNLSVFVEVVVESIPQLALISLNTLLVGEVNGFFWFAIIGSLVAILNASLFYIYWWIYLGSLRQARQKDPREEDKKKEAKNVLEDEFAQAVVVAALDSSFTVEHIAP